MISFATAARSVFNRNTTRQDQGVSGTEIFSGYLNADDHNTDWVDNKQVDNVQKMLLSDALIKASSYSFLLPILAGEYAIEPASDQPIDREIAEFVEKNYFENQNFNWNDIIRQVLDYLYYGFTIMSKSYGMNRKTNDGKWWLNRFEYLKPDTWERMYPDKDGDLGYIEQFAFDWTTQEFKDFRIDAENLFLIVNERKGKNYKGISLLRPVWGHFKLKQLFMKIHAAEIERWGIGMPVGTLNNDQKKGELQNALESIRAHEKSYLIKTPDYEVDVLRHEVRGDSTLRGIAYHDSQINTAFQRTFMALGDKGGGSSSFALAETMEGPFYDSVGVVAKHVETTFNVGFEKMEHIRQLVNENWANVDEYPKLVIRPKSIRNLFKVIASLPALVTAGILTPDDESENAIRESLDLPKLEENANVRKSSSDDPPKVSTKSDDPIQDRILAKVQDELIAAGMRIFTGSESEEQLNGKLDKYVPPHRSQYIDSLISEKRTNLDKNDSKYREKVKAIKEECKADGNALFAAILSVWRDNVRSMYMKQDFDTSAMKYSIATAINNRT